MNYSLFFSNAFRGSNSVLLEFPSQRVHGSAKVRYRRNYLWLEASANFITQVNPFHRNQQMRLYLYYSFKQEILSTILYSQESEFEVHR